MSQNYSKEFLLGNLPRKDKTVMFEDFTSKASTPTATGESIYVGSDGTIGSGFSLVNGGKLKIVCNTSSTGATHTTKFSPGVRSFNPEGLVAEFNVRHYQETAGTNAWSGLMEFGLCETTAVTNRHYNTSSDSHVSFVLKTTDSSVKVQTCKANNTSNSYNFTTVSHNSASFATYKIESAMENDGTVTMNFYKGATLLTKVANAVDSTSVFAPYALVYNVSQTDGYSAGQIDWFRVESDR